MDTEQQKMSVDFFLEFDLVAAPACEFSKDLNKKNNGKYNPSINYLSLDPEHDFHLVEKEKLGLLNIPYDKPLLHSKANFRARADSHTLSDFPLYHSLPEFRAVRLRLPQVFFKPRPSPGEC